MTKQELITLNYVQKVAAANIVLEIGRQRSYGLDADDLSDLYRIVKQVQEQFYHESLKIEPDMKVLHNTSLKLTHLLSKFMPKGPIEIVESDVVPVGTVKLPPRPPVQVFYGWADTAEYPTEAAIMASEYSFFIPFGGALNIPFQLVQEPKYSWFATPDTEPLKTNWDGQNSPLNKGDIGEGNLFGDPIHIGGLYYYITSYPTFFDEAVLITGGGTLPNVIEPGEIPETITPNPPTVIGNDTTNTLTATHFLGTSEILVSVNNGAYAQYTGPISVGDVDRAAGYWKFKIKAAQYRNESAVANSPAFAKVPVVVPDKFILTVQVNGTTGYTVYVNGAAISGSSIEVNEGTILNSVIVVKPGFNISPDSFDDIVMDQNRTLTFQATEIPVVFPDRNLTIVVNGLSEPYRLIIDGQVHTGNVLTFAHGTILDDVKIEVEGYNVSPVEFDGIVMDQSRTITFIATPMQYSLTLDTGGITGVDLYINEVLHTGPLLFNHGTLLQNISLHKAGYTFSPELVGSQLMDGNKTLVFVGTVIPQYQLSINVVGLESGYTISINGQNRTGSTFTYNEGTVINQIKVTAPGYSFSPITQGPITMDSDKSISFEATIIPSFTLSILVAGTAGYKVFVNDIEQAPGILSFPQGTTLSRVSVSKTGWLFDPSQVVNLVMDQNRVLEFTATQDISNQNYFPGFSAFDPLEKITRPDQGPLYEVPDQPGVFTNDSHRTDFMSKMRIPVGGEWAYKRGDVDTIAQLLCIDPYDPTDPELGFRISGWGLSLQSPRTGSGTCYWVEGNSGYGGPPYPTVQKGSWILHRRISKNQISVYELNGSTERFLGSLTTASDDFLALFGTIWDDTYLLYPQEKGLFHEDSATYPPLVSVDQVSGLITATSPLGMSEIVVSVNNGAFQPYTGPVPIANTARAIGYWRFKIKSSTGRAESVVVKSEAIAVKSFVEGKTDMLLSNNWNLSYNTSTKLYSKTATGASSGGGRAGTYFPAGGSAAIYFNGSTRGVNIGFHSKEEGVWYDDMLRSIIIYNSGEIRVTAIGSGASFPGNVINANSYRLIARLFSGARHWKLEMSSDNWVTYTVVHTYPTSPGNVNLYPSLFIGDSDNPAPFPLQIETRAQTNIPEMDVQNPVAPTLAADDTLNTLSASHALGASEIVVSVNNGAYAAYTGVINVGNVNRADGYWKFKIKAATGRNESPVVNSPAFTETVVPTFDLTINVTGPTTYTVTVNGQAVAGNVITVEENTVLTNIAVTASGWTFAPPSVASVTMDSDKSLSFAGTVVNVTPDPPTLTADDQANTLSASHALGASEILVSINNAAYVAYSGQIDVGNLDRAAGYWKFKIKSAAGRNESSVANSPAFSSEAAPLTLLPGFSYIELPSSTFTQANGVSTAITNISDVINKSIDEGGAIALKHKGIGAAQYTIGLLDINDYNNPGNANAIYISSGGIVELYTYGSTVGTPAFSEVIPQDVFLVFRRIGGVVTFETTVDGLSFTIRSTFSEDTSFIFIEGLSTGTSIDHLQGLNITDV